MKIQKQWLQLLELVIQQVGNKQRQQETSVAAARDVLTESVDGHYSRADKLIEEFSISPEVYKQADLNVRRAAEAIAPERGDAIIDHMISVMGEGSEKVLYYIGNPKNKAALNEFQSLMTQDPSGLKAAVYLGKQQAKLTNPSKATTNAPPPASRANGDESSSAKGGPAKKQYEAAHKKGNAQAAYNAKAAARKAGVDTSKW